jgi:hypothetical protein
VRRLVVGRLRGPLPTSFSVTHYPLENAVRTCGIAPKPCGRWRRERAAVPAIRTEIVRRESRFIMGSPLDRRLTPLS